MLQSRRFLSLLMFALVSLGLLAVSGCGPSRAAVSGTLKLPDTFQLKDDDLVSVTFYPDEGPASSATLDNKAKTFTMKDPTGSNLPAGHYKITVTIQAYNSADQERKTLLQTIVPLPCTTKDHTPLEYTVGSASKQSITIDLSAPPGKVTPGG